MLLNLSYFIIARHILCNSRIAGSYLVKSCGKTGDRMCGLVGNTFFIGSPLELCQWVWDVPDRATQGNHSFWTPLFRLLTETD